MFHKLLHWFLQYLSHHNEDWKAMNLGVHGVFYSTCQVNPFCSSRDIERLLVQNKLMAWNSFYFEFVETNCNLINKKDTLCRC